MNSLLAFNHSGSITRRDERDESEPKVQILRLLTMPHDPDIAGTGRCCDLPLSCVGSTPNALEASGPFIASDLNEP